MAKGCAPLGKIHKEGNVPRAGLEPARLCSLDILSVVRIPIPPPGPFILIRCARRELMTRGILQIVELSGSPFHDVIIR